MQAAKIFLGLIFFIYFSILFFSYYKSKKFFSYLFITALQGVCILFSINFLGGFASIHIPINTYTIVLSSLGGISGVIILLLTEIFLI